MVSSACRGSCITMSSKSNTRALNIDRTKDYTLPLQVETSVEYDLPSHIYPPKGSEPILMIHPAYTTPVRARKVRVTTHSPSTPGSSNVAKPPSAVHVHANLHPQHPTQVVRSATKPVQSKPWCSCGNPNCNSSSYRVISVRSSQQPLQQSGVLNSRQVLQIPDNILYSAVKNNIKSTDLKPQQQHKIQIQKQFQQVHQQKQIQLQQQQQQLQQQLQERAKLQAQQLQHLQAQQQKSQQQIQQTTNSIPRQQSTTADQMMSWGVGGRCQGPCCQPRIGALPPSQTEFLAPGLPPSLLARTPTRGPSGGSPKLRARVRRGLSVASTVNLPEYLGSTRSSRTNSVGAVIGGSSHHAHSRTRSSSILVTAPAQNPPTHSRTRSSLLTATPAPITAHQVASALDVVRTQVLTPRSLFASSQHQKQIPVSLTSNTSLLSTVGQSRDSGCSIPAEVNSSTSTSTFPTVDTTSANNVEYSWSLVDSGFCTPVETNEDQIMEAFDVVGVSTGNYLSTTSSSSSKEVTTGSNVSSSSHLQWMKEFAANPLNSSITNIHNTFLPASNVHYIHQPIWNLAY